MRIIANGSGVMLELDESSRLFHYEGEVAITSPEMIQIMIWIYGCQWTESEDNN